MHKIGRLISKARPTRVYLDVYLIKLDCQSDPVL